MGPMGRESLYLQVIKWGYSEVTRMPVSRLLCFLSSFSLGADYFISVVVGTGRGRGSEGLKNKKVLALERGSELGGWFPWVLARAGMYGLVWVPEG